MPLPAAIHPPPRAAPVHVRHNVNRNAPTCLPTFVIHAASSRMMA
jgi:hypothetical protein